MVYRFETNGEVVEFGQGRLIVQLDVEERNGGGVPDGGVGDGGVPGAALEIIDGVIFPETNPHGIGAFAFAVTSPENASIEFTSLTGSLCVRGQVGIVQNGDFANQWGAFVGLDLTPFIAAPWDMDGGAVSGFAFNVSGPVIPPLRFAAQPGGSDPTVDNFCRVIDVAPGADIEVPFESLDRDCWLGARDPMVATSLTNVHWLVPADELSEHAFDFCIDNLRPIRR